MADTTSVTLTFDSPREIELKATNNQTELYYNDELVAVFLPTSKLIEIKVVKK